MIVGTTRTNGRVDLRIRRTRVRMAAPRTRFGTSRAQGAPVSRRQRDRCGGTGHGLGFVLALRERGKVRHRLGLGLVLGELVGDFVFAQLVLTQSRVRAHPARARLHFVGTAHLLLAQLLRGQAGQLRAEHRAGGAAEEAADRLAGDRRGDAGDVLQHRRGALDETADSAEGALEELLALFVFELELAQFSLELSLAFAFALAFAKQAAEAE